MMYLLNMGPDIAYFSLSDISGSAFQPVSGCRGLYTSIQVAQRLDGYQPLPGKTLHILCMVSASQSAENCALL